MPDIPQHELETRVIATIAAALDMPPTRIEPSTSLQYLGAESLDFLDVAFRLEREFGIRMPRLNILERAEQHFGAGSLVNDGVLTDLGLNVIRKTMPEVDPSRLAPGMRAAEIGDLLSASTFIRVVRRMLAAKQQALAGRCSACGGALEASRLTPEVICINCRVATPLPAGDHILMEDLKMLTPAAPPADLRPTGTGRDGG